MFMTFNEWKSWVRSLDWSLKWFIILILLRPVVDNFYYLKEISPFLSPLYILGVATPALALYKIFRTPKQNYSRLDFYFTILTSFVCFSSAALLISDGFSLDALDYVLKFTLPFVLYFFCRRLIRSKKDMQGVFQTFIYSSIVVFGIFTYEIIFGPINIQISRGLERFQGSYSDVMNYAVYTALGLLINCYSFIEKPKSVSSSTRTIILLVSVFYAILILFHIHHTASYAVIAGILILFLLNTLRANLGLGLLAIFFGAAILYSLGTEELTEKIQPLIETDIKVYEGEKENEQLLHGRVGRWMNFIDYFNSKSSFIQFLGLPIGMDHPYSYIAKGSHNDFVRTLMFTGYLGLLSYLLVLFNLGSRLIGYKVAFSFLSLGAMSTLLLYSVSTTPLLYPSFMYIIMSIFSLMALPKKVAD